MSNTVPTLLIPASPGDVLDRLTILELKLEACQTDDARQTIHFAIDALSSAWRDALGTEPKAHPAWIQLHAINAELWQIEDEIRAFERTGDFGSEFVATARSVYQINDRRAAQKQQIDEDLGSSLVDLKFHNPT